MTTFEVLAVMPVAVPGDRATRDCELLAVYGTDHASIEEQVVRDSLTALEDQFALGPTDLDAVKTLIGLP